MPSTLHPYILISLYPYILISLYPYILISLYPYGICHKDCRAERNEYMRLFFPIFM